MSSRWAKTNRSASRIVGAGLLSAVFALFPYGQDPAFPASVMTPLREMQQPGGDVEEGWPRNGDVVFLSQGDVHAVSNSGIRQVTGADSPFRPTGSPAVAPDGSVVYYTCAGAKAVCWATPDGGRSDALFWAAEVQLAAQASHFKEITELEVSPDGKRVVFSIRSPKDTSGQPGGAAGDIFVYDLGSQSFSQITHSPEVRDVEPTWAPDGGLVWRANQQIMHLGPASESPRGITIGNQPVRSPDVSPDGRRVALAIGGARARDIWTMNLGGGRRRELTSIPLMEGSPTWSPDGSEIAFVARDRRSQGPADLWTMNADGRNLHRVMSTPAGDVGSPAWGDIPATVYVQRAELGPCSYSDQPADWCERVVNEPDDGTVPVPFEIRLTEPTDQEVSVTVDVTGKASAGTDYANATQSLRFTPNQTAARIEVQIIGDAIAENPESMRLRISQPTNASLGRDGETVYIIDDDVSPSPTPSPSPTGRDGIDFPKETIDAPTGKDDYAAFPGTVDTLDGDVVVVYRVASTHDLNTGTRGELYFSRSTDLGESWSSPTRALDTGFDARDPALYRAPGTRRLYLTYFELGPFPDNWRGVRLAYSDDDGATWSHPRPLTTGVDGAGAGIRRGSDGKWRWPFYEWTGSRFEARLLTAGDPLGDWDKSEVASSPTEHRSEWDFVEVSQDNWVAVFRTDPGLNPVVKQSTTQGRTWSTESRWDILSGASYDGWPVLRLTADGRVLCFIRGEGKGQRVVELQVPNQPLNPSNWREPILADGSEVGALDRNGNKQVGKFDPIRIGDTWYGAYYYETEHHNVSEIRFGAMNEHALKD